MLDLRKQIAGEAMYALHEGAVFGRVLHAWAVSGSNPEARRRFGDLRKAISALEALEERAGQRSNKENAPFRPRRFVRSVCETTMVQIAERSCYAIHTR